MHIMDTEIFNVNVYRKTIVIQYMVNFKERPPYYSPYNILLDTCNGVHLKVFIGLQ